MKNQLSRRTFVRTSCRTCVGCGILLGGSRLLAANEKKPQAMDLDQYTYCGYQCPDDCPMLVATQKNDIEMKKDGYKQWKWKEKFGIDFDAQKVFCWGCKNEEKPRSMLVDKCPVRLCAMEKEYKTCIQCDGLKECDKELWAEFSTHHEAVLALQEKYRAKAGNKD